MGDMADALTEQQEMLIALHEAGDCEAGCPYCDYGVSYEEGC